MNDAISGPLTAFDAITLVIILVSALMALARGFMRELATLGAFVAGITAAYYARIALHGPIQDYLPASSPPWTGDLILVVSAFIIAYALVAWFGTRLSRNIHGVEGLGLLDRLTGVIFGAARGGVVMVFFVLLLQMALPSERIPSWIGESRFFPALSRAADMVHTNAPRIAENVGNALPETTESDE